MSNFIQDGTGKGYLVKVDSENRIIARSVVQSEFDNSTSTSNAFNINTEFLTITNATETPILYIKNNEDHDLIVEAWFIGTDVSVGSATRQSIMRVHPNPTGGTIISSGSNLSAINRSIGSSEELNAIIKLGGDAFTLTTSGSPVLYQTQANVARNFGIVHLAVKKGSSLAVTIQTYGLTSIDVYTGFQVYKTNNI